MSDSIDGSFIELVKVLEIVVKSHREEVLPRYNKLKTHFSELKDIKDPYNSGYKLKFDSEKSELMWYGYSLKENKKNHNRRNI
ncbi:hypothetical protein KXR87_00660 [Yokenella regensburgei]|uniref:hypothetical protein n=1 Tax=Yokenella regensburgei TaxID=158877 RepID=UPI003F15AED6